MRTICVDVLDVVRGTNHFAVALTCIVIPTVKLVHDERRSISTDVLNLLQIRVGNHLSARVSRVRRQNHRDAPTDLVGNLFRMDMVSI